MRRIKGICGIVLVLVLLCPACREQKAVLCENGEEMASFDPKSASEEPEAEEAQKETLKVYVCGQVERPGVYELPADARVDAAIAAAGGMTEEAAGSYLNLAEHLADGQKIEVPSAEEAFAFSEAEREEQAGLVNLNTASVEQLMTLPGIGASKAETIVAYREEHGSFKEITELMEIPGIKEGVFQKIQDKIKV